MAKDDISQDETIDSTENIENVESKTPKEHKLHAHQTHEHHEHGHHEHAHHIAEKQGPYHSGNKNMWIILSLVLFVAAILFMVLWLTKGGSAQTKEVSANQVEVEMKKFIDDNLLQPGMTSTISDAKEVNGVYEIVVSVQGQNITSYASKDGKIFFPSGYKLSEVTAAANSNTQTQAPAQTNVPKTDKPVVDVFVMSYCPYGTQIEKGLLPVVDLLGSKADIQVKFVNYAMHGQKEIDENLLQYCVQQTYLADYYKYLQCFLADGNESRCVSSLGFDKAKLATCVSATDIKFNISSDYADKSTWKGSYPSFNIFEADNVKYGVQGSPTLVINGVQVSSARDSQSLKNAICGAFTTAPSECNTSLPTAGPSAGFGFGTSGTDATAANCGV
jgi:hypothetical protein